RRQTAAVDRLQLLELLARQGVTALDAGRGEVGPPVVVAGKADVGGKLGSQTQLVLPGAIEETVQPLALADRRGGMDRGEENQTLKDQKDDRKPGRSSH